MTDNEIIKALECCCKSFGNCAKCPYKEAECVTTSGKSLLLKDALGLINRQKAEIERLRKETKMTIDSIRKLAVESIESAKSEAYREFNARLYAYKTNIFIKGEELMIIPMSDYDEILKELTESNE